MINTDWKDRLGKLVYSTDSDTIRDDKVEKLEGSHEQFIVCKFETKGRKGKGVTIIEGFEANSKLIDFWAKKMKKTCSVGGSVKQDTILIQGNQREKIMGLLRDNGFKVKRVGG